MMIKILLFIPFYNCERQVVRVLKKVKAYEQLFTEILLVDNRSTDDSLRVVIEQLQELDIKQATVLQNHENYSLGGSHKVAFNYASQKDFSHLIVLHGDDQGDIRDFKNILQDQNFSQWDCILGARFHSNSVLEGYSRIRTIGNLALNRLCAIPCRRQILDMGSGLNLYSSRFFKDERIQFFPNDLTFNVFLLFHASFAKYDFCFMPLTWKEEDQVSNVKLYQQVKTILKLILKTSISQASIYKPYTKQNYTYDICYSSK